MYLIGSILELAIGMYTANHAGKFGDDIVFNEGHVVPKYDIYLDNVRYVNERLWFMPDLTLFIMYGVTVLLSIANKIDLNYTSFIHDLGVLYIIRGIACRFTVGYASPRSTITNGKVQGGANCYISDLVISGHTMTASILFYNILDICNNNWIISFYTLLCSISISSNLFVGDHYSSDVFLGIVIPCLLHY